MEYLKQCETEKWRQTARKRPKFLIQTQGDNTSKSQKQKKKKCSAITLCTSNKKLQKSVHKWWWSLQIKTENKTYKKRGADIFISFHLNLHPCCRLLKQNKNKKKHFCAQDDVFNIFKRNLHSHTHTHTLSLSLFRSLCMLRVCMHVCMCVWSNSFIRNAIVVLGTGHL